MGRILSRPLRLSQHRTRRGWSQADLASRTTVSRAEISAIETGRVAPSVTVALRLAAALGETVESLFGDDDPQAAVPWAWQPEAEDDGRIWRATVNGRLVVYPTEATAAGAIPHDGTVGEQGVTVVTDARPERTLVMAGCDPLVGLLVHEMAERHGIRVLPLLRSSAQAIDLLQRGLVHVAGVHLSNPDDSSANDQMVRTRLGSGYALLHQVRWDAGVAVASQRRERTARALLTATTRWVNREEGSAARHAFDRLLGTRRRPAGYECVVRDHRAVAATITSGWAEAGLCIRPAAAEANLRFIPIQSEAYELCVPELLLDDPRVAALTATLRSQRYRQWLSETPGCVSRHTSEQRVVV